MSSTDPALLIVDDDPGYRRMLCEVLAAEVDELHAAASAEQALELLDRHPVALVLLDMRMPGMGGLGLLEEFDRRAAAPPVIVLTAFAEVEDAVRAMKLGALDYLVKPVDVQELRERVRRALGVRPTGAPDSLPELPEGLVFEAPIMRDLLVDLQRIARSQASVLLTGESGCGKEVLAELLHGWSARRDGPLVRVNVTALPEGLVESELFGSARGAFTGADRTREGLLRAAHGGTLFLDEIGEMPLVAQPVLLRSLESGTVTRVGESTPLEADFRLVSATNRELEAEIEAGRFRLDLYYRLAVVAIEIPPLRERPEDILPLAQVFLRGASTQPVQLSSAARDRLLAHTWPGNVRELHNAMTRAAILAPGGRVLPEHLPPDIAGLEVRHVAAGQPASLAEVERRAILAALERNGDNRTHAARELGISRRKLLYRLKEYGESP